MYYKRKEPFRYAFTTSIKGKITNQEELKNHSMDILDISGTGLKVQIKKGLLPLPTVNQLIWIEFQLMNQPFTSTGTIVWIKDYGSHVICGIKVTTDKEWEESIVNTLKVYSKLKNDH